MENPATSTGTSTFSAETYFATQPAPPSLHKDVEDVATFVKRHAQEGRKVVLVTVCCLSVCHGVKLINLNTPQSGGTTVPLELNVCVPNIALFLIDEYSA